MRELITFHVFDAGSKTEFTNNSLNSPKIGKLNIDTKIIPKGLLIHEKNPDQKISCYCPFKQLKYIFTFLPPVILSINFSLYCQRCIHEFLLS